MAGKNPENDIDHIDGNPSNNRFGNLRDVSHIVNQQNRKRAAKHNISGLLGAHKNGNGWIAHIVVDGKMRRLGTYRTVEEAHTVYLAKKRELHVGCTI